MNIFDKSAVAVAVPFDNAANGFTASDVQAAIEEAKSTAVGLPRFVVRSAQNGTVGNNDWLGPTELHPNTPFVVAAVKCSVLEIAWSNQNTDVEFRIQFRTGSKTGPIFYTLTVTASNPGYGFVTGVNKLLNPGDTIWAKYLDDGKNMSDADISLWFQREL